MKASNGHTAKSEYCKMVSQATSPPHPRQTSDVKGPQILSSLTLFQTSKTLWKTIAPSVNSILPALENTNVCHVLIIHK